MPTVTNQDGKGYTTHLDCKHISASEAVMPDSTLTLRQYQVGSGCVLEIYPLDNPYGKDGDYDPKKRIASFKVKKDSECVIKNKRLTCE